MIKYYKELENPSNFTIPLIKYNLMTKCSREIEKDDIPTKFIDRYARLLEAIREVDFLVKSIDIEKMRERLGRKIHIEEAGIYSNETYSEAYACLEELDEIKYYLSEQKKIEYKLSNISFMIKLYDEALSKVIFMFPGIKKNWMEITQLFSSVLEELESYNTIIYKQAPRVPVNLTLPNAWYITPYGDLYNTGEKGGHKETNLIYSLQHIERVIPNKLSIEKTQKEILEKRQRIIKNGFIDYYDFSTYLNYCYYPPYVVTSSKPTLFNSLTYHPKIVNTIRGIVSAKASFYNFFVNLQKYTKDPKYEFNKLINMTKRDIRDILVRCAGFYKIESSLNKTITTSSLTPFEDLFEYIKRGWDVYSIPPIVVAREEGIIKELDLDSPMVKRYIEKDINKYNKCKQKGYGRIY